MATVSTSPPSTSSGSNHLIFPPCPPPDPFTQIRSPTPSALLVFLAATPPSETSQNVLETSAGAISPRRRWSSQKEPRGGTQSAPCSARRVEKSISLDCESMDRFFLSSRSTLSTIEQETDCSASTEHDHPSPLPSKGLIRKFRKRILSSDKSSSAPACTSCNGTCSSSSSSGNNSGAHSMVQAANSYSPRQRPLFVDTQITNHLQQQDSAMKRRSPVSQVVDFVRGRNRTYSLQLSSSPMCSPQSVGARASASCDGPPQPLLPSPGGRRQTLSGRVHRASFTGGTLKSFDSGLDLSSPTINHTALLIKEVSRFFLEISDKEVPRVKNQRPLETKKSKKLQ
ncbi:hypothetical protein L5515_003293 [Caenorhabditis briggsae]|uniref:Uncharacterized protein n=1 Tax=Caenorhabditis briggsae TaxID=6238 RepID=A0AAE9JBR4_CAEBR|nr:hypothetical protein L5515_003293 [Caenorhabditis briggsae]